MTSDDYYLAIVTTLEDSVGLGLTWSPWEQKGLVFSNHESWSCRTGPPTSFICDQFCFHVNWWIFFLIYDKEVKHLQTFEVLDERNIYLFYIVVGGNLSRLSCLINVSGRHNLLQRAIIISRGNWKVLGKFGVSFCRFFL